MSDQSSSDSFFAVRLFKSSHRTRPEQCVGFSLFSLICLGFAIFTGWLGQDISKTGGWYRTLAANSSAWFFYYFILSVSVWTLWRRFSLRVLKLEIAVFFSQFVFQAGWALSFFAIHETLPALAFLLILWCNTLLAALLFWKKERLAGQLLTLPSIWIFYCVGLNMMICISNP